MWDPRDKTILSVEETIEVVEALEGEYSDLSADEEYFVFESEE